MAESKFPKIKKRDGRLVDWDQSQITDAVSKALVATGENETLAGGLSDKVVLILNERLAGKIPGVEQIQDIVEEVLQTNGLEKVAHAYHTYRQKRAEIREAKWWLLNFEFKTKLSSNALRVLESRYLNKNDEGKIVETPQELFKRVSQNISSAEKIYKPDLTDEQVFQIEEKFYHMMASLEFLPNSPTLMNAGNPLQQLSACFVIPIPDSMDGIFDAVKNGALIHQSGGGTGYSFARLRPKGDIVKSTKGVASGPISFMTVFDAATQTIKQGGKRRGANMGILRVDHPDILEFITAKTEEGILSNFNISVAATDDFMKKAKLGEDYDLINPRTGQVWGKLNAKKVFDMIVRYAWQTGDPGVIFIDRINEFNPTPRLGDIESTNPCGEQPLLPYESCNLGSINLAKMLAEKKPFGAAQGRWEINWQKLRETVSNAVRFLDNVVEVNRYPLPQIEEMTKGNRKIGLGVMGFADMLIRLEMPYNSKEALSIAEKIMKFIQDESKNTSAKLAEERGAFPNFKNSIYDKEGSLLKMRNATTTTIAPTGTIGIIAGCSSGIEPLFTVAFTRKHVLGGQELVEINPVFEEIAKKRGFYSEELIEKISGEPSIQNFEEIPKDIRQIFITTFDIVPEDHVRIQAAFQKYSDNAVSKTINFPFEASEDDVRKAYFLAFDLGCKGVTVFRTGSRQQQVLNIKSSGQSEIQLKEEKEKIPEQEIPPELRDPSPQIPDLPPGACPTCNI
ncbi:MAG: vitamin B12-dependent ribonucleotide reductase [Candidatus Nealsonbacteria bacterium]|nr:vitamin B12-dependent ribonucleotide reductase [Candidatus Nealsonbacteria bacterium]